MGPVGPRQLWGPAVLGQGVHSLGTSGHKWGKLRVRRETKAHTAELLPRAHTAGLCSSLTETKNKYIELFGQADDFNYCETKLR